MRYQPYVSALNYSFTLLGPLHMTKLAFTLSDPGLEVHSGTLTYEVNGKSIDLPIFSDLTALLRAEGPGSIPAKLDLTFTDGTSLTQDLSLTFVPWLSRLIITFKQTAPSVLEMNALVAWEYAESQSGNIADETTNTVFAECKPLEVVPMSMTPSTLDGSFLPPLALDITCPNLVLIPDQQVASGIGYGRQIDESSVQEIYQIPRTETLSTMNQPWQMHEQDKVTLGEPLAMMDPKTVVAHTAHRYVNQHNLTQHNAPFNYDAAKAEGATLAPKTSTTWTQEHQGNKTVTHQGTLNQTRQVDTDTQVLKAPQINQQFDNYDGSFSGDSFQQTAVNYYEQSETESSTINDKTFFSPSLIENINTSTQFSNSIAINTNTHTMTGKVLTFNGHKIWRAPKIELDNAEPSSMPGFQQRLSPAAIQSVVDSIYQQFVATVYAETEMSCVLMKDQATRFASGAYLYHAYLSGQYSYPELVKLIQSYKSKRAIHLFKTGFYNHPSPLMKPGAVSDGFAAKAVASVIVNRAQGDYINGASYVAQGKSKNLDILMAFTSRYRNGKNHEFNGYLSSNYNKAFLSMAEMKGIDDTKSIKNPDVAKLYLLLENIYFERKVTTDANMYISPIAQLDTQGHFPDFSLPFASQAHPIGDAAKQTDLAGQLAKLMSCWRNVWSGNAVENVSDDFAFLHIPKGLSLWG